MCIFDWLSEDGGQPTVWQTHEMRKIAGGLVVKFSHMKDDEWWGVQIFADRCSLSRYRVIYSSLCNSVVQWNEWCVFIILRKFSFSCSVCSIFIQMYVKKATPKRACVRRKSCCVSKSKLITYPISLSQILW